MDKTRRAAWLMCSLLTLGAMIGGCGSGHRKGGTGDAGDAPIELFGTWRLVQISGGITGQGFPIPSEKETLSFDKNGTVTRFGGGLPTEQKKYHVTRRKTLLNADVVVPVVEYDDGSTSQIIEQVDAQNLGLADEANDGTGQSYTRIPDGV